MHSTIPHLSPRANSADPDSGPRGRFLSPVRVQRIERTGQEEDGCLRMLALLPPSEGCCPHKPILRKCTRIVQNLASFASFAPCGYRKTTCGGRKGKPCARVCVTTQNQRASCPRERRSSGFPAQRFPSVSEMLIVRVLLTVRGQHNRCSGIRVGRPCSMAPLGRD
jgi:hypothetical protein